MKSWGLVLVLLVILLSVSVLSVNVRAEVWSDEKCEEVCIEKTDSFFGSCNAASCLAPQCKYSRVNYFLFVGTYKCLSTGQDDGATQPDPRDTEICTEELRSSGEYWCDSEDSVLRKCDSVNGNWALTEEYCSLGCDGSGKFSVCNDECNTEEVESECYEGLVRKCEKKEIFGDGSSIPTSSWWQWTYPDDLCDVSCEEIIEEGKPNRAWCNNECQIGETKCFPISNSWSYEIRECQKTINDEGREIKAFVQGPGTQLCPFGCVYEYYEKGGKQLSRAKCTNTDSFECDKICKSKAGAGYDVYTNGMCIDADPNNVFGACEIFGGIYAEAPEGNVGGACDTYDFYVIDSKAVSLEVKKVLELAKKENSVNYNVMKCADSGLKELDCQTILGDSSKSDIYVASVSSSKAVREIIRKKISSIAKKRIVLVQENKDVVYDSLAKSGRVIEKECCCTPSYRPLKTGGDGETVYKESPGKEGISCEVACWRKYNNQVSLYDIFNNIGGYTSATNPQDARSKIDEYFHENIGQCESIDLDVVKEIVASGEVSPDFCDSSYNSGVQKSYDNRLKEGNRGTYKDSIHCNDNPDSLDVCCCRDYVTSEANAVENKILSFKEWLKRRYNEFQKKLDNLIEDMEKNGITAGMQGQIFKIYLGKEAVRKQEKLANKMLQQIRKNPLSLRTLATNLFLAKRIDIILDDGKSRGTVVIDMPSLSMLSTGRTDLKFSIGGAIFDENYFFGVNAKSAILVNEGDKCYSKQTADIDEIFPETYGLPVTFKSYTENGVTSFKSYRSLPEDVTSVEDALNWINDYNNIKDSNVFGISLPGTTGLLKVNKLAENAGVFKEKFESKVVLIGSYDHYGDDGVDDTFIYKGVLVGKQTERTSTRDTDYKACPGSASSFGLQTDFTASVVFGRKEISKMVPEIDDNFYFDNLVPTFRVALGDTVGLGLDANFYKKLDEEGKKTLNVKIYGQTSFDVLSVDNLFGFSVKYTERNKANDEAGFWYEIYSEDPVARKYRDVFGSRWDSLISQHLDGFYTKEELGDKIKEVKKNVLESMKYMGTIIKWDGNGDAKLIAYAGFQHEFGEGWLDGFIDKITAAANGEIIYNNFGSILGGTGGSSEYPVSASLHGSVQVMANKQQAIARIYSDVGLTQGIVQVGVALYHANVKFLGDTSAGISTALTTPGFFSGYIQVSPKIFNKVFTLGIGARAVGDLYFVVLGQEIPVGYMSLLKQYGYPVVGRTGSYLWHRIITGSDREMRDNPPRGWIGISQHSYYEGTAMRLSENEFNENPSKTSLFAVPHLYIKNLENVYNDYTKKKECKLGCTYIGEGSAMCVEALKNYRGSQLSDGDTICSGDNKKILEFKWNEDYPYKVVQECSGGCEDTATWVGARIFGSNIECDNTCEDGTKKCSPDEWHQKTCVNGNYVDTYCEYGCDEGTDECKGVACNVACVEGTYRCGFDEKAIEKCDNGEYKKAYECSTKCDPVALKTSPTNIRYACFENNDVVQEECGPPEVPIEKDPNYEPPTRCSADGLYIQTCNYYEDATGSAFIFEDYDKCLLGCENGVCLTTEEVDLEVGDKFCSPDRKNVIEVMWSATAFLATRDGRSLEVKNTCSNGCSDGDAGLIEKDTKRCSYDLGFIETYNGHIWIKEVCALGCDYRNMKCREEITCDKSDQLCSSDGSKLLECDIQRLRDENKMGFVEKQLCTAGCFYDKDNKARCYSYNGMDNPEDYRPDETFVNIVVESKSWCSYDGMNMIRLVPDETLMGLVLEKEECLAGCSENSGTASCNAPGQCREDTEMCSEESIYSESVYSCQHHSDKTSVPEVGFTDSSVDLGIKLTKIVGAPSTLAIRCTDGFSSAYYLKYVGPGNIVAGQMSFPLSKQWLLQIVAGSKILRTEQLRELTCDIGVYPDSKYPSHVVDTGSGVVDVAKYESGSGVDGKIYYDAFVKDKKETYQMHISGFYIRVKPSVETMQKVKINEAAMFSPNFCDKKITLLGNDAKCTHGEGWCDDDSECSKYDSSGREIQLECKGTESLSPRQKICCLPWEEAECFDSGCDDPVCVMKSDYVVNGSRSYCRRLFEVTGEKCGYMQGDCDPEEDKYIYKLGGESKECGNYTVDDVEKQLYCFDAPGWDDVTGLEDICCLPGDKIVRNGKGGVVCASPGCDENDKRCELGTNWVQTCQVGKWQNTEHCVLSGRECRDGACVLPVND